MIQRLFVLLAVLGSIWAQPAWAARSQEPAALVQAAVSTSSTRKV